MISKIHITVFQTGGGSSAAQITPYRYRRQAGTHKQSMVKLHDAEIWFSWPRGMNESEAITAAEKYAHVWDVSGRPTTGDLRRAIETGQDCFIFNSE